MSTSRLPLLAGAGVAAILIVQFIISFVISVAVSLTEAHYGGNPYGPTGQVIMAQVLPDLAFGAGIWISLRYVARVRAGDPWRRVMIQAVIAVLFGAAAVVVLSLLASAVGSISISEHPLVNQLDPQFTGFDLPSTLWAILYALSTTLFWWAPLGFLAAIFVRIQLDKLAKAEPEAATDRASDAESLVDR